MTAPARVKTLPNGTRVRVTLTGSPRYRVERDRGGNFKVMDNAGRVYSMHKDKRDADAHVRDLRAQAKRKAKGRS